MSDNSYWENGKHLWVTSKDMKSHRISDSRMKISDKALTIMTQYKPGTILIVTRSGILRHSLPIAILEKDATINQDLKAVSFYIQDLHPYIYYAIKAQESFILKEYHKDGTTVDSINFEKFSDILLPIPPKQEQIRIITTIEKLFGLIEEIDNNKKDLQEFVRHTKSIILDMAIYGKLVPQDPADEPAEELLRRINPAAVSTDTSHYSIPSTWIWVKLSDIFEINPKNHNNDEEDCGFVPMSNVQDGYSGEHTFEVRKWGKVKKGYSHFQNGDIGVAKISPCFENLKSTIFHSLPNNIGAGTTELVIMRGKEIFAPFFLYLFKSPWYISKGTVYFKGVVGQQRVSRDIFTSLEVPLPPLNEQKRISAKVDELFAVIDQIQQSLE